MACCTTHFVKQLFTSADSINADRSGSPCRTLRQERRDLINGRRISFQVRETRHRRTWLLRLGICQELLQILRTGPFANLCQDGRLSRRHGSIKQFSMARLAVQLRDQERSGLNACQLLCSKAFVARDNDVLVCSLTQRGQRCNYRTQSKSDRKMAGHHGQCLKAVRQKSGGRNLVEPGSGKQRS